MPNFWQLILHLLHEIVLPGCANFPMASFEQRLSTKSAAATRRDNELSPAPSGSLLLTYPHTQLTSKYYSQLKSSAP